MQEVIKSSNEPDLEILERLSSVQYACLAHYQSES
jgi:hypothetical protein